MDAAVAGLIGALIGGLFSLLGSWLSNVYLIRKQREQWYLDRQAEHADWVRERLQEIYSNAIECLSKLNRRSLIFAEGQAVLSQEHQREIFTDYSEAQKWLGLFVAYHPLATIDNTPFLVEYKEFAQSVGEFSMREIPDLGKAKDLRALVIAPATMDTRLHYQVK